MNYKDISVVVSGPVYKDWTSKTIDSIRKVLSGAEIIFSTWIGEDVENLDADHIVWNEDPGNFEILSEDGKVLINNLNRQIVSTREGVKKASRKFVLKMRAESEICQDAFLQYWDQYPLYDQNYKFVRNRIIAVLGGREKAGHRYVFNLCDWYFFGYKEDILSLWDIPLLNEDTFFRGSKVNGQYSYEYNMHEENYLAVSFAKKFMDINYFEDERRKLNKEWKKFMVNNFVCTGVDGFGINSLKYPPGEGLRYRLYYNYYTYGYIGWSRLYNKLLGGHLKVKYDLPYILKNLKGVQIKMRSLQNWFKKARN